MSLGAVFLLLAMAIAIAMVLGRPFMEMPAKSPIIQQEIPDHRQVELLSKKEKLLAAIQELEFDHDVGKVPDDIFNTQRRDLMEQAAGVLEMLDQEFPELGKTDTNGNKTTAAQQNYDEVEELIARRRLILAGKSTGFCPQCGKAVLEGDRFCSQCGYTLRTGDK